MDTPAAKNNYANMLIEKQVNARCDGKKTFETDGSITPDESTDDRSNALEVAFTQFDSTSINAAKK